MGEKRALQTGRFPTILVEGDTLSDTFHKGIIACYERGCRVETPKHKGDMSLGFDAHITLNVSFPGEEPVLHKKGFVEDARGLMQYILEVTHGIHDHWKKCPEHPEWWNYTYHERLISQIPFALARIKNDWEKKGRISGRDYFFSTWRSREDCILEEENPPCLQNGQLRFLKDSKGAHWVNYLTSWRSRDEAKAQLENNVAQIEQQKLLAAKVSNMLGIEIRVGSYIDTSNSLHIYGLYLDRDNFKEVLDLMRSKKAADFAMGLEDYLDDRTKLKRLIAAQMDAEARGCGLNQPAERLKELNYDLDNFTYPKDWDTWPKEWDVELDPETLR